MEPDEKLKADALHFMERHSVVPASEAQGYRARNVQPIEFPGMKIDGNELTTTQIRHTLVGGDQRIAYVHLEQQYNGGRGWSYSLMASMNQKPGWIPAYFLPWDEKGAAVEVNIPDKPAGTAEAQHPKLFFTAALSGCSVYVKGTPSEPTVLHCGIGGIFTTPPEFESASDFWDLVIDLSEGFGFSNAYIERQAAVHNRDYMRPKKGGQGAADGHATAFKGKLEAKYADLQFEYVEPWGAVFGIRNGTQWTFYLQENATIVIRRAGQHDYTTSRPMVVRQIFPTGGAAAVLTSKWKSIRKALGQGRG